MANDKISKRLRLRARCKETGACDRCKPHKGENAGYPKQKANVRDRRLWVIESRRDNDE